MPVVATEHQEQSALIEWWDMWAPPKRIPKILLYAVPNGGRRDKITGAVLKREGVRAGACDLNLDVLMIGYHGLRIEMKKKNGRKPGGNQEAMHEALKQFKYKVVVCYGWMDARREIVEYLGYSDVYRIGA